MGTHNGKIILQKKSQIEVVRVKYFNLISIIIIILIHHRGDTHLTMKDTINGSLKVDLRVINDKLVQKTNQETEVCITEASKEHPSELKFHADRCKIQVENKVVIDNYIQSGCNIDSVDSIQICGLELFIVNLTLKVPGLYVGNEIYHVTVNKSLSNLSKYLDLALQLLCFRVSLL